VMLCRNNDFRDPAQGGPLPWQRLLRSISTDGGNTWTPLVTVGIDTTVSRPHTLRHDPARNSFSHTGDTMSGSRSQAADTPAVSRILMAHNDDAIATVAGRLNAAVFTSLVADGPLMAPLENTSTRSSPILGAGAAWEAPLGFTPGVSFSEPGEVAMYPQMAWGTVPTGRRSSNVSASRTVVVSYSSQSRPRSVRVAVIRGLPTLSDLAQTSSRWSAGSDMELFAFPRRNTAMEVAPAVVNSTTVAMAPVLRFYG